jgi:uncharacterized membrane protein YfcA
MTGEFLLFLCIGAVAGGFINGLAGFGTSLFALGWWLQVMPPVEAVATALIMSLISGFQGMLLVWPAIDRQRLARFVIPALIGVPIGLKLLEHINANLLTIIVAVFLIAYGGFFTIKNNLPSLTNNTPFIDVTVGFAGGILGAVAGLSGALPTMLCSMRPWSKMQQRAVLQPFNYIILGLSAILLFFKGAYDANTITTIAIVFPVTLIASLLGISLFKRVSDLQFRRLLVFLMLVSGLVLLPRAF